ncbi:MAG: ABC transporter ATP-binding protein [Thermoanaerobaculia bacterium]|nr:ABC transporter ATP-binding protein [Thermoanaerobaculia bacterium]
MIESVPLLSAESIGWSPDASPVLGPLDFRLDRGDLVVVVGHNGAGKTSLLRLLAGIIRPTRGELNWQSKPYTERSRRDLARDIAYLPQLSPLSTPLTVREFVHLGRYPHQSRWSVGPTREDFILVEATLQRLALDDISERPLGQLSGGERQRAALAGALAQGGSVWLLDEPTTHLDPQHRLEILRLLEELHQEGVTMVVTTHDLNLAARLATRVVALSDGEIRAEGRPEEVLQPDTLEHLFHVSFEVEQTPSGLRIWMPF